MIAVKLPHDYSLLQKFHGYTLLTTKGKARTRFVYVRMTAITV